MSNNALKRSLIQLRLVGITANHYVDTAVKSINIDRALTLEVNGKSALCRYLLGKEFRNIYQERIAVITAAQRLS